jgi:hypothetical protein
LMNILGIIAFSQARLNQRLIISYGGSATTNQMIMMSKHISLNVCVVATVCLILRSRKRKEEREKAEEDRSKKLAEERKEKVEAIKRYCKNKHLVFCQNWRGVYLFEVDNERAKETLKSADSDRLDSYVSYMKKHSVVDARLVADGNLDKIYEYIRR